jgi:FkbM family methyltransferase
MNKILNLLVGRYPFRFILAKILIGLKLSKFFKIKMNDGYFINFVDSALSISYFVNKSERYTDVILLKDMLRHGNVVVDIGANIGTVTLPASKFVGNKGKVYSFEPHPKTFTFLQENVKSNKLDNIELFCLGCGNKHEILKFTSLRGDDQNKISEQGNIEIKVVTLDSVLTDNVDLLKIDTEGWELNVLQGSLNLLKNTKAVFIEFNTSNNILNGIESKEIIKLLYENSFSLFTIDVIKKEIYKFEFYEDVSYRIYILALKYVDEFVKITNYKVL